MFNLRILKGFSHTIELSSEHYIQKYQQNFKDIYNLSYPPIPGHATIDGTKQYSSNNSEIPKSHFRTNYRNNLLLSSLGIGSYQGAPDQNNDIMLYGSIIDSVLSGGVNVIDTAINYRYMKSERVIGAAIRALNIPRDQLFISSKGGYIPADGDRGIQETQLIRELINKNLITQDDVVGACHCMHPKFLEMQLEQTLNHLGLETLDLLYLHNAAESQLPFLGYEKFYDRVAKAFEQYEKSVQNGKIKRYGMATWVCFRAKPDEDRIHVPLEKIVEIAERVGGKNHHFEYVQMPINAMMPEAFSQEWQPFKGENTQILTVARQLNVNLVISSPLMGGTLMQVPLPSDIFKCQFLGAKHLQFLRSIPAESIKTILIGQKANRHTKQNLEVIRVPPLTADEFWSFFQPLKRKQVADDELDMQ
ncbi:unnamed protein product (macronuclear) [Paramecium tetraurelia]|uniref:NADP-dependent oxidoreductase domain-containing protein n=1 Tax=Paramecium tetraurelia TaxID=5888 RepID=A0DCS5_PARTE|nr:uncharacterized protein GSPATT00015701001 [Paramecium tetraurelia]CAK80842.1 unnamed protein product [Paramecium tetraurelia]|eukprot:XP_001448239.1 hypothetical protein (macronuclear) [Paramecium tetraurelia strain d4-2]